MTAPLQAMSVGAGEMIDPETVNWDYISDILYRGISVNHEVDNRPFPREQQCRGCLCGFMQKRNDHRHCSEACRWKDALRQNGPAAERARKRFRDWYQLHKEQHIANVERRRRERKAASLSLRIVSIDTGSESTEASPTSELSRKSSKLEPAPITSKTTKAEHSTGAEQSQCG